MRGQTAAVSNTFKELQCNAKARAQKGTSTEKLIQTYLNSKTHSHLLYKYIPIKP